MTKNVERIRVLVNRNAGAFWSFGAMQDVLEQVWNTEGVDLTYQFSKSIEDGRGKARRAVEDGTDVILVVGGDGMVNSIGRELIGTQTAIGVIPAGSGNGFARHFDIPSSPEQAAQALLHAERKSIDVGRVNGEPFFVTCSMAWDAALVRTFERSPVRGILPYALAGVYEYWGYVAQPFEIVLDEARELHVEDPVVFTVANMTQYGGGARIAPKACPDDGLLELIVIRRKDAPKLIMNAARLFDGTIDSLPEVSTYRFKTLRVVRKKEGPIQLDGELKDAGCDVHVDLIPAALQVLVPTNKKKSTHEPLAKLSVKQAVNFRTL